MSANRRSTYAQFLKIQSFDSLFQRRADFIVRHQQMNDPSHHLNDIAIRHWDGYWFGKRQLFGDTMPHYWSTITATAFHYLARIRQSQNRAQEATELQGAP